MAYAPTPERDGASPPWPSRKAGTLAVAARRAPGGPRRSPSSSMAGERPGPARRPRRRHPGAGLQPRRQAAGDGRLRPPDQAVGRRRPARRSATSKDHSDSVYGVAFSPDGKLLASAAADRAVKVWDVATGNRLYTLGESTDWVYAVAWSPTASTSPPPASIAASASGRSTARAAARPLRLRPRGAGATALVYSADGKTLYSLGEDRSAKAWDRPHGRAPRLRPAGGDPAVPGRAARGSELAVGRFDGALVLLDEKTGKVQASRCP